MPNADQSQTADDDEGHRVKPNLRYPANLSQHRRRSNKIMLFINFEKRKILFKKKKEIKQIKNNATQTPRTGGTLSGVFWNGDAPANPGETDHGGMYTEAEEIISVLQKFLITGRVAKVGMVRIVFRINSCDAVIISFRNVKSKLVESFFVFG